MKKLNNYLRDSLNDARIIHSRIQEIIEEKRLDDSVNAAMLGLMLALGATLAAVLKNSGGENWVISFLSHSYWYGGFSLWLSSFAAVIAMVMFFAKAMTWTLNALYNVLVVSNVIKTNMAQLKQAKAKKQALAKRMVYKKAKENLIPAYSYEKDSFEAMKERFDPIMPVMQEILAKYE